MFEVWKPVVGLEGSYEVSDLGQVRSVDRWVTSSTGARRFFRGQILKPTFCRRGYAYVAIGKAPRPKLVHRLVAAAFIGPCPEGMEVLHGPDGVKDNRAFNLSYGTRSQNAQDKVRDGTEQRGEKHVSSKLTETDVLAIRDEYDKGAVQVALAEKFSVHQTLISLIVRRKAWKHV